MSVALVYHKSPEVTAQVAVPDYHKYLDIQITAPISKTWPVGLHMISTYNVTKVAVSCSQDEQ